MILKHKLNEKLNESKQEIIQLVSFLVIFTILILIISFYIVITFNTLTQTNKVALVEDMHARVVLKTGIICFCVLIISVVMVLIYLGSNLIKEIKYYKKLNQMIHTSR